MSARISYTAPEFKLPSLKDLKWKSIDTLPEIQSSYDDSAWTAADHPYTNNSANPIKTPTSLLSTDYGYSTGALIYRGSFVAAGNETSFAFHTEGGLAFGNSAWINSTYIGSWVGSGAYQDYNSTYELPTLQAGQTYVLTIVIDNMGLDENGGPGSEGTKDPRGILDYDLSGRSADSITWKLTGNLGGEDYQDLVRGPLNEGGLYAERQGFHQPEPPSQGWNASSPFTGVSQPGVQFYSASFDLDLPKGWDIPLYFDFSNSSASASPYRVQLFVNGYQYGKYVNNVGPQTSYPVPEGILNYHGTNWIAVSLWAQDKSGAKLDGLDLVSTTPVLTALGEIEAVDQPKYQKRSHAY